MSDLFNLLKWIADLIKGSAIDRNAKRLRLEQEAWQWLERHLCFFEEQAHTIYSLVLQNSAEKVLEELCSEKYPFVEKLSHFPLREDSALKINFRRLEKKIAGRFGQFQTAMLKRGIFALQNFRTVRLCFRMIW